MSREDWEIFDQLREERRQKKSELMAEADLHFSRLRDLAADAGLLLTQPGPRHWQVRSPTGEVLVNYWPSTRKQQNGPSDRARRGVRLHDFEYKLRLLCDQYSSE